MFLIFVVALVIAGAIAIWWPKAWALLWLSALLVGFPVILLSASIAYEYQACPNRFRPLTPGDRERLEHGALPAGSFTG